MPFVVTVLQLLTVGMRLPLARVRVVAAVAQKKVQRQLQLTANGTPALVAALDRPPADDGACAQLLQQVREDEVDSAEVLLHESLVAEDADADAVLLHRIEGEDLLPDSGCEDLLVRLAVDLLGGALLRVLVVGADLPGLAVEGALAELHLAVRLRARLVKHVEPLQHLHLDAHLLALLHHLLPLADLLLLLLEPTKDVLVLLAHHQRGLDNHIELRLLSVPHGLHSRDERLLRRDLLAVNLEKNTAGLHTSALARTCGVDDAHPPSARQAVKTQRLVSGLQLHGDDLLLQLLLLLLLLLARLLLNLLRLLGSLLLLLRQLRRLQHPLLLTLLRRFPQRLLPRQLCLLLRRRLLRCLARLLRLLGETPQLRKLLARLRRRVLRSLAVLGRRGRRLLLQQTLLLGSRSRLLVGLDLRLRGCLGCLALLLLLQLGLLVLHAGTLGLLLLALQVLLHLRLVLLRVGDLLLDLLFLFLFLLLLLLQSFHHVFDRSAAFELLGIVADRLRDLESEHALEGFDEVLAVTHETPYSGNLTHGEALDELLHQRLRLALLLLLIELQNLGLHRSLPLPLDTCNEVQIL
eukprot:Rhum_TRINITY_DN18638_c0_g1::Rhum_TRINITY_DN18638_c0_g1_i1::g.167944::m.167944